MNKLVIGLVSLALAGLASLPARAETELDKRVAAAQAVLTDFNRIPEQAIPSQLLDRAYAVAVIPNVIKGGFIVGASYGKGVLTVRREDGSWSNPAFVKLANLGLGWQAGGQGSDLILVFKGPRGVDNIARGKFTIGGSASASAGPVGRTAMGATDGEFKSEIYTYARSRGLFAGVSLDGGAISIDHEANASYYDGLASGAADRILNDATLPTPASARPFLETLASLAPPVKWEGVQEDDRAAPPAAAPATAPAEGTRTYGMDEDAPETRF